MESFTEGFIRACKEGITYQRLVGKQMSSLDLNGTLVCPFCGQKMKALKTKTETVQWVQHCDCEEAQKINLELNEQIKIVEDAQDKVTEIYKKISQRALQYYQKYYAQVIHDQRIKDLSDEKIKILNIVSLD